MAILYLVCFYWFFKLVSGKLGFHVKYMKLFIYVLRMKDIKYNIKLLRVIAETL